MLTYSEFQDNLRDLLNHLYDHVAVETHPLITWFPRPQNNTVSLGEHVYDLIRQEVEALRPQEDLPQEDVAWRPYLILKRRYLEGVAFSALANELALSERQLRRYQARAIEALAHRLWQRFMSRQDTAAPQFDLHFEWLLLDEVLQGVRKTLSPHLQAAGRTLDLRLPQVPIRLYSDRVVLRQVLIRMVRLAMKHTPLYLAAARQEGQVVLCVPFSPDDAQALEETRPWVRQLSAQLQVANGEASLQLPARPVSLILVVDDQPPTLRMFQRYLGQSSLQVVGVDEPRRALDMARRLQPALITLDVMMPAVDGWELLQNLQAAPETRHIPVIVCSAWDEPELAASLGAVDFLKKPITRDTFLAALRRHGVLD